MPLLVHGVSRGLSDDAWSEGDDPAFRTVADGQLVAFLSETDVEEALPTRANLLHHLRVLEHVGEHLTVLPMRFGVVVPDADALVADFLGPEQDRLLATLDRIDGHVELRLRGSYDEPTVIREVLDDDPRAARLRGRRGTDAKIELGERIVHGIERRRDQDRDRTVAALRPHAAAVTTGPVSQPLDVFACSFLVARTEREDFERAVGQLGESLAPLIRLELVGPVPPFSFTDATEAVWA